MEGFVPDLERKTKLWKIAIREPCALGELFGPISIALVADFKLRLRKIPLLPDNFRKLWIKVCSLL